MKNLFIGLMVILVAGLITFFLITQRSKQPQKPISETNRLVQATAYNPAEYMPHIKAIGQVKSQNPIQLVSEVAGMVQSTGFSFRKGASFSNGRLLIKIDDRQAALQFQSAIAQLLSTLSSVLPDLKHDIPAAYDRWKTLFDNTDFTTLAPLPQTTSSQEKLYLSRAGVFPAYFTAKNAEVQWRKHFIHAPFSGTITQAHVFKGSAVTPGMPLGVIEQSGSQEIEVELSPNDVAWITPGSKAAIEFTNNSKIEGYVTRISPTINSGSQTQSVFVRPDNQQKLTNGSWVTVSIYGKAIAATHPLPRRALLAGDSVFAVQADTLAKLAVDVVWKGADTVLIRAPLLATQTALVTETLQDATAGQKASIRTTTTASRPTRAESE